MEDERTAAVVLRKKDVVVYVVARAVAVATAVDEKTDERRPLQSRCVDIFFFLYSTLQGFFFPRGKGFSVWTKCCF